MGNSAARTDFENSIFASQPGLATERWAKPGATHGQDAPTTDQLASERMIGVRPLGQLIKCVINGQALDFLRSGPLLMIESNDLRIPGLVSQLLPQANAKGRQRRIQDFASAVYQDWLVLGPLTQLVYLGVAGDDHLHLVNFPIASNGAPACLLFRPYGNGQGQLAISAPGSFSIQ
jgi:hypothetical protein